MVSWSWRHWAWSSRESDGKSFWPRVGCEETSRGESALDHLADQILWDRGWEMEGTMAGAGAGFFAFADVDCDLFQPYSGRTLTDGEDRGLRPGLLAHWKSATRALRLRFSSRGRLGRLGLDDVEQEGVRGGCYGSRAVEEGMQWRLERSLED